MDLEEGDDSSPRVHDRRLVVASVDEPCKDPHRRRQLCRLVVVEEAVAGVGIHLDLVIDARRGEHRFEAVGFTYTLCTLLPSLIL
jgi:hypothetical protein